MFNEVCLSQVIDVLKDIKDTHHFELFSSMLIFLKSVKPTEKVVKKIIFLQNFEDQLVSLIRQQYFNFYLSQTKI